MSISIDGFQERIHAIADILGSMADVAESNLGDIRRDCENDSPRFHAIRAIMDEIGDEISLGPEKIAEFHRRVVAADVPDASASTYATVLRMALDASELNVALAVLRNGLLDSGEMPAEMPASVQLAVAAMQTFDKSYENHVAAYPDAGE